MTIVHAIILGALQGLTEFLPISSDGHLFLAEYLLGIAHVGGAMLHFDIVLHLGSLLAIVLCYWSVWMKILHSLLHRDKDAHKLLMLLIIATIPGAVIGLLFEDVIGTTLRSTVVTGLGFFGSAFVLLIGEAARKGTGKYPTWLGAILIGCAQAAAILPGLSRSGSTIASGRLLKLSKESAVDFSFLMAAPIIAGAGALPLLDLLRGTSTLPPAEILGAGFITSLFMSVCAIQLLRFWVRRFAMAWFALYLIPLGIFVLTLGSPLP